MRKAVVVVHCVVLGGVVVLWRSLAIVRERVDETVFACVALLLIESVVVAILTQYHQPRQV
jgi:hypothetical protein